MSARQRILEAMLELAADRGYEETSVEEIVAVAGVGRAEFDRLFAAKEECALAVFDRIMEDFNREVHEAYESEPEWPDSLRAAANAAARYQAEHPRELRFGALEMLWASGLAEVRREAAFRSFVGMVDAGRERAENPELVPAHTAERVIGSIAELVTKRAQRGKVSPQEFVPELMYLAVLPYLGQEEAEKELEMRPSPASGEE